MLVSVRQGCAKTGSGVFSQTGGKGCICKENNQGASKIWVCRGFMESYSCAGDFILGVAKQCHSADWTLQALWGWKLRSPHSPDSREKEMSGVALRWLMIRILPTAGRRYPLVDICPASLPVQGGSIGLNTSFKQSKSCMWQKRPSLLPPHYLEYHKTFERNLFS